MVLSFPFGLLTRFPTLRGASFHGFVRSQSSHTQRQLDRDCSEDEFVYSVNKLFAAVKSLIDRTDFFPHLLKCFPSIICDCSTCSQREQLGSLKGFKCVDVGNRGESS